MQIFNTAEDMQKFALSLKTKGNRLGLVPTMGYLHDGHLALVKEAKEKSDFVIASIYVNPTQFGPNEDLSRYPRDEAGDLKKLEQAGCDAVFLPSSQEIYPEGFQSKVSLSQITQGLCGASRPGHFDGVATIVLKLFNITQADVAVFGEKDFQQLALIRQMVKDLNLPIEIIGHPTQRSSEGLALSSRNSYLSAEEKEKALVLSRCIRELQNALHQGEKDVAALLNLGRKIIEEVPEIQIEYLEIVDALSLKPISRIEKEARVLVAVKLGRTRLIDNGPLVSTPS